MDYPLVFKALSDENRLNILNLLLQGQTCGCNLLEALPILQPTLSYHLKLLSEANLVTSYKEKTKIHYQVNNETLDQVKHYLDQLGQEAPSCRKQEE